MTLTGTSATLYLQAWTRSPAHNGLNAHNVTRDALSADRRALNRLRLAVCTVATPTCYTLNPPRRPARRNSTSRRARITLRARRPRPRPASPKGA